MARPSASKRYNRRVKYALLVAAALFVGCGGTPAKSPAPPPTDISKVLDDWHDAAAKADEERYFAHFATGAVFLGTDGTERWTLPQFRAFAHPYFAKGKAWSFRSTRRDVEFSGDVAWFDEDLDTPNLGPARGSGVLLKTGSGEWKIAQYNLSIPIPNEKMKDVKALIAGPQ